MTTKLLWSAAKRASSIYHPGYLMKKIKISLILSLTVLSVMSAASHVAAVSYEDQHSVVSDATTGGEAGYVIGPQNVIQIKIFGEAGISQVFRVDELGYITHPLVGRIQLAGLSVSRAERVMERALDGDYIINPQVTIFVMEHSRYSILGEVNRPGSYELQGHVSAIEAISIAGGFSPVADQRQVIILRKNEGGEETIQVDATQIIRSGDRESEVYIQANDVIVVPKSFF